ncbi:MAG: HNH endonuclease [Chloroflexi bacterium]|nr:HNH endonuclease [Chloroflexota bacterium]
MASLPDPVREQVFARAEHRCEYCHTSRRVIGMPLVVDHVVPKALGGSDDLDNLCAACYRCNEYKGTRTHAADPASGEYVPLFNPRIHVWREHLTWANGGTHLVGLTPNGRATVVALHLNNEYVVESRVLWIARHWHPPIE